MDKKEVSFLLLRYLILLILGISNLFLFYFIFTPLTVYPTFWVLKYLYGAVLYSGNVIFFKGYFASIIPACIAGAAYYLLLILNLTTPMEIKKRTKSIIFLLGTFLILNLVRILIFAMLLFKGYQYFDLAHTATWYFGSTALVIVIWFGNVLIFKIKEIPIYSDLKNIYQDIKNNKSNKS